MGSLPAAAREEGLRARRWDVMVLGSGIRALIAAARLGLAGRRVLVVEEDAARSVPAVLREPFHLGGLRGGGGLDACLRELRLPLIDRRRLVGRDIALQLVSDRLRMDVGVADLSASELVAWDLAKPDEARACVTALLGASERERDLLRQASLVRAGRRLPHFPSGGAAGSPAGARTIAAFENPAAPLAVALSTLARAVSNNVDESPHAAGRHRVLGDLLSGGVLFDDAPPWLSGILRRRVESLLGEFRAVAGHFELVEVDGLAGLRQPSGELWLASALVLGTPPAALGAAVAGGEAAVPEFVRNAPPIRRRLATLFDIDLDRVPEGMARRVVLGLEPGAPADAFRRTATIALDRDGSRGEPRSVQLTARVVLERDEAPEPVVAGVERHLRSIMPDSGDGLRRRELTLPAWDDDDWLEEIAPQAGAKAWPPEIPIRVGNRPAVYSLPRAALGGLGLEGDALLGWSAGDAISADLD